MGSDTQTITYSYQKNILAKSDHSAHITTGKLCPFSYLGRLIWPQLRCSWCGNAGWYLVYLMHRLGLTSCQAQNGLLFRCVCISRIYSVSHSLSHSLTKMKNQELYILSQSLILCLSVSQSQSQCLRGMSSQAHLLTCKQLIDGIDISDTEYDRIFLDVSRQEKAATIYNKILRKRSILLKQHSTNTYEPLLQSTQSL